MSRPDFAMRSCWECNASHEGLKEAPGLFRCYECGRWFKGGAFVDGPEFISPSEEEPEIELTEGDALAMILHMLFGSSVYKDLEDGGYIRWHNGPTLGILEQVNRRQH